MHSAGSKNLGGKPIISTFFIWHNMQKHGEIRIVTAKHMTAISVCLWKSCFIVCNFSSKRSIGWSCGDTGHRRLMFSGLIFFEITSMKRWGKDFDSIYHNMRIQSTTWNFATRLQRSFFHQAVRPLSSSSALHHEIQYTFYDLCRSYRGIRITLRMSHNQWKICVRFVLSL